MTTLSRNMKVILGMTHAIKLKAMTPRPAIKIVNVLKKVSLQRNAQRMEDTLNVV